MTHLIKYQTIKKLGRKYNIPIGIGIPIVIFGIMFKIMHWPNAALLLIIGPSVIAFFYFLRFLDKSEKKKLDYAKLALVVSFCIRFMIYTLHWPGKAIASGIFLISLGFFITLSFELPFFQEQTNEDGNSTANSNIIKVKNVIVIAGVFAIVFGSIFKIMHWPGASILLIVGLIIIAAWAIVDLLLKKE